MTGGRTPAGGGAPPPGASTPDPDRAMLVSSACCEGTRLRWWPRGHWPRWSHRAPEQVAGPASDPVGVVACAEPIGTSWRAVDPDAGRPDIERALRATDGRFALLGLGRARVLAATDIIGCGGLFLATRAGRPVVATHLGMARRLLAELGAEPETDPVGLAAAAFGSISVDGRTPLDGVQRLPAGCYALADRATGQWRTYRYADPWELTEPPAHGSLLEALEDAVAQEEPADSLLLSGGYDSFAIGSVLSRACRDEVLAVSYGGLYSVDRWAAPRSAAALGLAHADLPLCSVLARAAEVADLTSGTSGLQTTQHLAGAALAARRADSAYSGFLGDLLSGKPYDALQDPVEAALERHWHWTSQLSPAALAPFAGERAEVEASLRDWVHRGSGQPWLRAAMLDLLHRQAHWIAGTFDLMHMELDVRTPFVRKDVIRAGLGSLEPPAARRRAYVDELARRGHPGPFAPPPDWPTWYYTASWDEEVPPHRTRLEEAVARIPDPRWRALAAGSLAEPTAVPMALFILPCFGLPTRDLPT